MAEIIVPGIPANLLTNPMTTIGDLIVGAGGGAPSRIGDISGRNILAGTLGGANVPGVQFNGTSGKVTTPVIPGGNVPVSVVGFFKIPNGSSGTTPIWDCPPSDASYCDFGQGVHGTAGTLDVGGPNHGVLTGPSGYDNGNWHWFATTITPGSGGAVTLWLDGSQAGSAGDSYTFSLINAFELAYSTGLNTFGNVALARVGIWTNVTLTTAQLNAVYAAIASGSAAYDSEILGLSPSAYYPLNESTGTTATDVSPHGNNGTYVGGVTLQVAGPNLVNSSPQTAWSPALATSPPDPTTATLVSGTAYQNTTGYDAMFRVPVTYSPTGTAAATLAVGVGPTAAPTQVTEDSEPASVTAGTIRTKTIFVPANWYVLLTATNATLGTATVQAV